MKKIRISKHINLLDEAYFLLYQWVNKSNLGEVRLRDPNLMRFEPEVYTRRFGLLTDIFHDITEQLKDRKDRIEYYFKERSSGFSTLAALALLWEVDCYDNRLVTYKERLHAINEEKKVKIYADIINSQDAPNAQEEELKSFEDLLRLLDTSAYDKDIRWETIKIYHNQEASYHEVYYIISEVQKLLKDKYSKTVSELEQEFYTYWSEYIKNSDIIETFRNQLKITWECEKETMLVPCLFQPYSITFSITEAQYCNFDMIRISVMLDADLILADKKISKEDVVNIGKLFSDKSKMDILELISEQPYYGREIANELNLTTATISYHVNTLLQMGFIKAQLMSNKVYYSIDKERITAYLDEVKNYFSEL